MMASLLGRTVARDVLSSTGDHLRQVVVVHVVVVTVAVAVVVVAVVVVVVVCPLCWRQASLSIERKYMSLFPRSTLNS